MIPAYGVQVQKQGNFFPQKVQVGQKAKRLNFTTKPIQKFVDMLSVSNLG